MQTQAAHTMNGVPVDRLLETIGAIEAQPDLGVSRFRAANRWVDGALNQSEIEGFYIAGAEDTSREVPFVHQNDEPPVLLGENRAANPVEYVLHGLAGCVTTTFVYYAAARGIELDSVESTLEGELDLRGMLGIAPIRAGYQGIKMRMRVASSASDEELQELARLAMSRSPVFSTVSQPVDVEVTLDKV